MHDQPIALIVNAGGQSLRMGQAKALLPMPRTGAPMIAHIIRRLLPLVSDRLVVVTNDGMVEAAVSEFGGVHLLRDRWVQGGALGGLATGLMACAGWAMVVACDMPFVEPTIFAKLADVAKCHADLDAVIPRVGGQAQPFHGLWHRRVLPVLAARLEAGELGVQAALAVLKVLWMDEESLGIASAAKTFYNVNTVEEWVEAQGFIEEENKPVV
jgi:molybdopterin-guanine dinucleotide biosynthesis protein A